MLSKFTIILISGDNEVKFVSLTASVVEKRMFAMRLESTRCWLTNLISEYLMRIGTLPIVFGSQARIGLG